MGGNKKGSFTEAWVEFERKKVAKRVAAALNNTRIGGKKSDFFASDLWNIKYLHKFKWSDLTQAIGEGAEWTACAWRAPSAQECVAGCACGYAPARRWEGLVCGMGCGTLPFPTPTPTPTPDLPPNQRTRTL